MGTPVENAEFGILCTGCSIPLSQERPTNKTNVVTLFRVWGCGAGLDDGDEDDE